MKTNPIVAGALKFYSTAITISIIIIIPKINSLKHREPISESGLVKTLR